jgi:hypothetical protein
MLATLTTAVSGAFVGAPNPNWAGLWQIIEALKKVRRRKNLDMLIRFRMIADSPSYGAISV